MARSLLLCSLLLCVSAAANATDVHKCATPTGISYQGVPCDGPELPTPVIVSSAMNTPPASSARTTSEGVANAVQVPVADNPRAAPDCDARPRQARRLPWRQATICIGMTDDEVLNLPGWGRPAKIVRTRAPREWREAWTYDARVAVPRQLHFVNGKLALVETESTDTALGSMARVASN